MKTALTIAGSDCSGGAGIQADLKTMSALGVFGMSVILSVVAENTSRVISSFDIPVEYIEAQLDAVFEDMPVDAVKIGMMSSSECIEAVAAKIERYAPRNVVTDPVMYAKDGFPLMKEESISTFIKRMIPLTTCLTPNIPEAERISGIEIKTKEDMQRAAVVIADMGAKNVLVKGGHFFGDPCDVLYDGKAFAWFYAKRIRTKNTHGTGCTLSSAIASYLALGMELNEAVERAKLYVTSAIEHSLNLGKGNGPLNHFFATEHK